MMAESHQSEENKIQETQRRRKTCCHVYNSNKLCLSLDFELKFDSFLLNSFHCFGTLMVCVLFILKQYIKNCGSNRNVISGVPVFMITINSCFFFVVIALEIPSSESQQKEKNN
jgi:hypothetical protein